MIHRGKLIHLREVVPPCKLCFCRWGKACGVLFSHQARILPCLPARQLAVFRRSYKVWREMGVGNCCYPFPQEPTTYLRSHCVDYEVLASTAYRAAMGLSGPFRSSLSSDFRRAYETLVRDRWTCFNGHRSRGWR